MTKSRSLLRWGLVGGVVGAISLAASASQAQVNVYNGNGLNIDIGVSAGVFYGQTRNTYFGAGGNFGYTSINGGEADVTWQEGYVQPAAYVTYDSVAGGQVYLNASLVASAGRGDGDPTGFTDGHGEDIDWEDGVIGWAGEMSGIGVDLSYGRQDIHIGTDFIFGIGHFDQGKEGTYWIAPRYAFERVAKLSLDNLYIDGLRSDIIYLESDQSQADTDMALINIEYAVENLGDLGFLFARTLHADGVDSGPATFVANPMHRKDMDVLDFRAHGNPIASMMPNWFFAFEYAKQQKDGESGTTGVPDVEVDANAWYVDIGYSFVDWPWAPAVTARHAHFSGDDPNTAADEAYDGLFYGFTNWGTWFIGEVTGEYVLFQSNFDVNMLMVQASPYDNLFVTAAFFDFQIDEAGAGVDDDFGQEIDLMADWSVNDNMAITGVYAVLEPGGNAEATFGGNDDAFSTIHAAAWIWF